MNASIRLEAIGYSSNPATYHPSSWVAEITGPSEKYGLEREFLRGKYDFSGANSAKTRGVYIEYTLESGHIYEVKSQLSWGSSDRYYCQIGESGEMAKIGKEKVYQIFGTNPERRR